MDRPTFPKRAIITSGMPYGNKELHFGHIGGLYVHADVFARFLRDRIGEENVIFQSGTDCYGSPILEGYRKLVESGKFDGDLNDFVRGNHEKQVQTFLDYDIKLNFFGASSFGPASKIHNQVCADVFNRLYEVGAITKMDTMQFFDESKNTFLNGRQVIGRCPVEGCKSEKAYADECDLGHQYLPCDLINPISTLSNEKPVLKPITNWYFKLTEYTDILIKWVEELEKDEANRTFVTKEIREFLKKPEVYIKKDQLEEFDKIKDELGAYTLLDDGTNKNSITIGFEKLTDREKACAILAKHEIRFRTGKTLVPFRLTGNIEWGVPTPVIEGEKDLTFYVWPESLWAPISFTKTYLETAENVPSRDWKDWWCHKDSAVYQFLGEDNMYFYGPAEMAIFLAMQGTNPSLDIPNGDIILPNLVINKHILFMDKKASSSGKVKPPMAHELLKYYTNEQLRCHFLGMGLGNANVSFKPKMFNPNAQENEQDLVLKEGNLLTNVYNRVLRYVINSLAQKYDCTLPEGKVSEEVLNEGLETAYRYEELMSQKKFHIVMNVVDSYVRNINKYWQKESTESDKAGDTERHKQAMINVLYMIRIANLLLHPIAPTGSELVAKYLGVNKDFFSWDGLEKSICDFNESKKITAIEARFDFFKKLEYQY